MRDIENLLRPHMNMSLNDYIQSTGMAQESVWESDIEIFAASSLLTTDIYVYSANHDISFGQVFLPACFKK